MKKNLLFGLVLGLLFAGCSFKDQVESKVSQLNSSAAYYAAFMSDGINQKAPKSMDINGIAMTVESADYYGDTVVMNMTTSHFNALKEEGELGISEMSAEFCKQVIMRALLEKGVIIKVKISNYKKSDSLTVTTNKKNCSPLS